MEKEDENIVELVRSYEKNINDLEKFYISHDYERFIAAKKEILNLNKQILECLQ
jgi:hypothetical protein